MSRVRNLHAALWSSHRRLLNASQPMTPDQLVGPSCCSEGSVAQSGPMGLTAAHHDPTGPVAPHRCTHCPTNDQSYPTFVYTCSQGRAT